MRRIFICWFLDPVKNPLKTAKSNSTKLEQSAELYSKSTEQMAAAVKEMASAICQLSKALSEMASAISKNAEKNVE